MFAFLASHPKISMVRRTNMWRWFSMKYGDLSVPENFERCFTNLINYKRMDHLKPDSDRIREEFRQGEPTYGRLFALFHRHNVERRGKPRWGDKSLHTEHHADQIFKEFSEAKVIHMICDPRDWYASILKRYDDSTQGMASTSGRWLTSLKAAKRNLRKYPHNYIVVTYETLTQKPEETLQRVCKFIGEAYVPDILTMSGAPEHSREGGNSSFGRFKPGVISTRSIGCFRKVLTDRQVALIQFCVGQDMPLFNYQFEQVRFMGGEKYLFYLIDLPLTLIRMTGAIMLNGFFRKQGEGVPKHRLKMDRQLG
jgi:hypothetical protein